MLVNMISDKDMERLKKVFLTKKEFKFEIDKFRDEMVESVASMGDVIIKEIRAEIKELKDQNNDIIDNHERRLDRLKDKVFN